MDEIREDRMPHGKLFQGKPGDAKLAIALAYANAILCTNRTEHGACGEWSNSFQGILLRSKVQAFIYAKENG